MAELRRFKFLLRCFGCLTSFYTTSEPCLVCFLVPQPACRSEGLRVYQSMPACRPSVLPVCLSACVQVYWSAGLLVCWFAGLLVCWSAGLPFCLVQAYWSAGSICWSVWSTCQSTYPSVCLTALLFVYLYFCQIDCLFTLLCLFEWSRNSLPTA